MMKEYPALWAFNPYADVNRAPAETLKFIKALLPGGNPVELTYVLSPKSVKWDQKISTAWLKKLKPSVEQALSGVKLKEVAHQNILISSKGSLRHDVDQLCKYARRYHAPFVVLSTHARKGLSRLFMGSFTETAIVKSQVPILIINPQNELPKKVDRVLIATDLTPHSLTGIKKLIPFLKSLKVEAHLFHKMMDPIDPVLQSGVVALGGGWVGVQGYLQDELERRQEQLKRLADSLTVRGVRSRSEVEVRMGRTAELIIEAAHREKCQMIIMGANSNAVEAFLGASVTRAVARAADLPLFIYPAR